MTPDLFPGSFKYTPLEALRNLFVGFLQGLFNAAPPGSYHWDPDPNFTDIIIQDEAPVKEEVMQKRPLITLTRGPIQFYSFGMDDMLQYNADIDRKTKSILVPGTMSVNCCSRVALEAENIAWVVGEHIWLLRDLLIKSGLFDTGRQIQLSAPAPAGSLIADDNGDTWTAVSVSVPFQIVRTSAFTPLGLQIVQNIESRITTTASRITHVGPPPVASHERPLGVYECPPPPLTAAPDARGGTARYPVRQSFLPKQRHPLDPAREVVVRTVRPYAPGQRPAVDLRPGAVPIPNPCMKESCK
jgi:hypothetical protein